MAEEQIGLRREELRDWTPWTKIFTAFKIALDPKKLLLAGLGILVMAIGWYFLSLVFFSFNSTPPEWDRYRDRYVTAETTEEKNKQELEAWKAFKDANKRWNLLFNLAGWLPPRDQLAKPEVAVKYQEGPADLADSPEEYRAISEAVKELEDKTEMLRRPVVLSTTPDEKNTAAWLVMAKEGNPDDKISVKVDTLKNSDYKKLEETLRRRNFQATDLLDAYRDGELDIDGIMVVPVKEDWKKFEARMQEQGLQSTEELIAGKATDPERVLVLRQALQIVQKRDEPKFKAHGRFRTLPWFEYRGQNPFLLVQRVTGGDQREATNEVVTWLGSQAQVLLEPLVKFVSPVVFLFNPAARGWNLVYLILIIFWTLATWAFFGGAITRMAAVQAARPNEKVGVQEAVRFTSSKYRSYLAAQVLPLAFLAGVTLFLLIYGFFEVLIPIIGDVFIAGLMFPLVILFGLLMAVVLVGLIGWPLMHATISTEGSDSFDAISRSYSYVYGSPWTYLWYGLVAVLYGAALVFFVGLMGSLTVFLGKWGMSQFAVWSTREPSYLFMYAPTSYGWRDLLLSQSANSVAAEVILPSGRVSEQYGLAAGFVSNLSWWNYLGAWMVAFWIYLLFLMVIGFGYSYFWSAASVIYLLMRRKVDDTEMDEIHLEEDEMDVPYSAPPAQPAAPAGNSPQMVEAPALRQPSAPPATAVTPAHAGPSSATPAKPVTPVTPAPAPEPPSEEFERHDRPRDEHEGFDRRDREESAEEPVGSEGDEDGEEPRRDEE